MTVHFTQCCGGEVLVVRPACSPWWIYYKQLFSYCFNLIHFWVCVWWLTPALFSKDQHILLTLKKCNSKSFLAVFGQDLYFKWIAFSTGYLTSYTTALVYLDWTAYLQSSRIKTLGITSANNLQFITQHNDKHIHFPAFILPSLHNQGATENYNGSVCVHIFRKNIRMRLLVCSPLQVRSESR